jgi:hypothetical protein
MSSTYAQKKENRDRRTLQWEREAVHSLTAEAMFFGRNYVPVREIRERLDPILRAHEVREIMKVDIGKEDKDDTDTQP